MIIVMQSSVFRLIIPIMILGEMHGIEGRPGALIDACIHLATTDDLHMQFDIVIIISTGNKTCTVQSQCTSNSAAIYMMVLK